MISGDFGRFLERCHAGASSFDAWIADLAPALGPAIAPREGLVLAAGELPARARAIAPWGGGERMVPIVPRAEQVPRPFVSRAYRPFLVTRFSRQFGRTTMAGDPNFERHFGGSGIVDLLGISLGDDALRVIVSRSPW